MLTGSIPASAGKPRYYLPILMILTVYPRVRGEAATETYASGDEVGLSPRPRGSLLSIAGTATYLGSIPASAGKPSARPRTGPAKRVYP